MQPTSELMQRAATHFLAALTPEQRALATCPFEDEQRFTWHFTPVPRRGIPLKDLTPAQRALAQALIAGGYSPSGAAKALTIMSLEEVLLAQERERAERTIRSLGSSRNMAVGELVLREGHEALWQHIRNPELYFLTIFGEPAPDRTWGWRLEGHHVSLNVTLPSGRLGATTPCFFGANPAEVRWGPRAGLRALAAEEDLGRALLESLDERQRSRAVIDQQAPDDILTFNQRRAEPLGDAGLPAAELSPAQIGRLHAIVETYAATMPREIAEGRMEALARTDPSALRFAWAGGARPGERHYYRIQAPAFLIEYDNTQDDANHIHTVWRDFAGDWGLDLLGAHLTAAHAP